MLTNDLFAPEPSAEDGSGSVAEAMPQERARTGPVRLPGLGAYAPPDLHPRDVASDPARGELRDPSPTDDITADRQAGLRALRSLEATEARLARTAKRELEDSRGKLVQDLLPVLDNLERTIRAAQAHRGDPAMLEGVRMVRQQLDGVLRGYGVERVEAIGQRFDPNLHEAIGVVTVADPAHHGVVVQQAEPGYRLAGRLLRPAKVSVGKLVPAAQPAYRPHWR
jgi:molecular chaperone GrpE